MLPKSYIVFKWTVYGLATIALFAFQYLVLDQITVWGLTPFLYPMLPAVAASYEGLRRGSVFALVLGVVCDLLVVGPFDGFYTLAFTLAGVIAALIGENLLSPGFLCALVVSVLSLLLTAGLRILFAWLSGGEDFLLMGEIALGETLLTIPAVVVVFPLYRWVHKRCTVEY